MPADAGALPPGLCATAAVALVAFDDDGVILEANTGMAQLVQHPAGALVGQRLGTLMTLAGRVVFDNHLLPVLKLSGRAQELALQLRTADGGGVFVMCSAVRLATGSGPRNECAFMPMNERKRIEQELLRIKHSVEHMPGALLQLLLQGGGGVQVSAPGEAVCALLALPAPGIDAPLLDAVHADDRARVSEELQASARDMRPWHGEFRLQRPGAPAWRAVEARPQRLDGGRLLWHGYASDISSRKAVEAAVAETVRVKEMLLHEVHHRVKNSLQLVSSLLSLQARGIADADARAALQEARTRVSVVARVHEQLYESGAHGTLDIAQHLRRLAEDTLSSLGGGRIRLDFDGQAQPVLALEQAVPLSLVLAELLTNAVKYAFPGGGHGTVTLRLTEDEGRLRVALADDGVGLPAGFDPGASRGLGMRIVQALLLQLDAQLENPRTQRGACFVITMRACSAAGAPAAPAVAG
ncbi:sensor histidine kinase [Azohydromonas aeria]|uniref:sensor histidine kinase n=1 Tax=Azohydromonas aeria TaxID=2590212 RepID=UPI0012F9453F|nr:histidine kinase dimerization/phosphoacceptor domain -containing protein [Azohydromonas aeria]